MTTALLILNEIDDAVFLGHPIESMANNTKYKQEYKKDITSKNIENLFNNFITGEEEECEEKWIEQQKQISIKLWEQ